MRAAECTRKPQAVPLLLSAALLLFASQAFTAHAFAQTCTTQSRLAAAQRDTLADAASAYAQQLQAGDVFQVRAAYASGIPVDAGNDAIVKALSAHLAHSTLRLTQLDLLNASSAKSAAATTDFACPLLGAAGEVDFSIANLPAGVYAFALFEADGGALPWQVAMLLQQQSGAWKLAGFTSHARTVAAHDGLWYWRTARERLAAKQTWAAYVLYNEAYVLLQPAPYVSTTHLEKLIAEQRSAAPPELVNGLSADTPYAIAAKGSEFRFTDIGTAGSDDGARLNLVLHFKAELLADPVAARARNVAAAAAFLDAHPDVRMQIAGVTVFADTPAQMPFATQHAVAEIP